MKRVRNSTRLDRWQKALIEKSDHLRTQGVRRTPAPDEEDVPAPAAAAPPPRRGVLRWARRIPSAPSDEEDTPAPRRSRRKEADALQASGLDYQHALQLQWWEYRHTFLEAMRLDLEIRSDTT